MASRIRHVLVNRPWVSLSVASVGGVVGCANYVEYRSNQQEYQVLQRQHAAVVGETEAAGIVRRQETTLPRTYDWEAVNTYWTYRPVSATKRLMTILYELGPSAAMYLRDFVLFPGTAAVASADGSAEELQRKHAERLRTALTNLGPAFVKAGQQLSIRPDLVPPVVLKELQHLCDAVRPVPDEIALQLICDELELGAVTELETIFDEMKLVAAASIGQVYKAKLRETGQWVAVKVQRPEMLRSFSLDLFLLQKVGSAIDTFTTTFTNQPAFHERLYESFAAGSYSELDYENEARNQLLFKKELAERNCPVVVPQVYLDLTTQRVLTTEWIDGIKLADAPKEQIRKLIPVGVELFLTQLLDMGTFHADPHPGNLLVVNRPVDSSKPDGPVTQKLCLLDFGLCATVDERARNAMTTAIVHLITRDFDSLIGKDAKELGFFPDDYDVSELKPILTKILTVGIVEAGGSNLHKRKRKLMEISNELNEVFFRYPFSVPPFFALVTRGMGLLEGIALTGDPEFDIFQASAPYARRRAVAVLGDSASRSFRYYSQKAKH